MGHPHQRFMPSVYGRYETLFRIAAGGMAEVYAARVRGEAGFQKLVALKRMLPHLTDDERFVNMFMDEGKLAANISSPNVVSTLDLGRADDGSLYLVMELVVGTTLSDLLRNAAKASAEVPIDIAVEMLAQAGQGLHDAHEAKTPFGDPLELVHRDISPQNVLVGTDGRVRITDFGVARAVLRRTKTSTGEFKGKLSYFSPEQCADKHLDRRSDVFSLGVVAWETFTTRRLFHAENPLAVLERVTRMPIPSAHEVRPEVPAAVAEVVAKALERDRDLRYGTAMEFAQALRDAARASVGVGDRHRVSELVRVYGGEALERVQRQLRQSLSSPGSLGEEPIDDAKTEISSGIIFRPEGGTPLPATPRPQSPPTPVAAPAPMPVSAPSFVGDPLLARPPEKPASKLPVVIASLVAVLGLSAGGVIGVIAATSGDEEPLPQTSLPSDEPSLFIDPADLEPPPIEEPAPEPLAAPAPPEEPARRRPRARRGSEATPPAPAAPAPVVEDVEPDEVERAREAPRPRARRVPVPAPEVRPLAPAPPAPAPEPPRRRGGLVGLDGFDNDVGR